MFGVNCYRITTDRGLVLVDTGTRKQRARLEERLWPDDFDRASFKLILITHGDFDHIGSAAYLRQKFGTPIAMHKRDALMSMKGDMLSGRKRPNLLTRALLSLAVRLPPRDRFEPDLLVDEDSDLAEYGLDGARVLVLRGHSAGSIGLLLADGSLLCGDLLENRKAPRLGSIMDDVPTARASVERLNALEVGTVYPGHGRPFQWRDLSVSSGGG
jgi:glyoxylase-like metal-dependent hydrolase (beta-lactamase superfamily II)